MKTRPNDFIELSGDPLAPKAGLTKIEHFASLALQGLAVNGDWNKDRFLSDHTTIGEEAIKMAKDLIENLNKTGNKANNKEKTT